MQPIEIFGKEYQVIDGFVTAPSGESIKVFKPRSLVKGRRVNMAQMLEATRDLFQQGKSGSEIAAILDKDTDTVGKYKKIILAFNALDENAITQTRTNENEWRNDKVAEMVANYPQVAKWQERLLSKPKASKKTVHAKVNGVNRVCRAVGMSPMGLLQKGYTGDDQLAAIDDLMATAHKTTITSEASFYQCRICLLYTSPSPRD